MEKHRCKLCNKNFSNGRALGGHMRSHLSTLPLPSSQKLPFKNPQNFHFSDSSSTRTHDDDDHHLKPGFYELRENPKKSCKVSPVQDGESDTESTQYPTRRRKRSKRVNKSKWAVGPESPTESTQVSSVSDSARSRDEEVALCLMMLSRDAWIATESTTTELKKQPTTTRVAKFKCMGCKKVFRTSRALEGHKASNKQCCLEKSNEIMSHHHHKIFECPFCYKVFGSGQALGGHKRSHLISLGSTTAATNNNNNDNDNNNKNNVDSNLTTTNNNTNSCSIGDHSSVCFVLDLNFPPPIEVDDVFVA